MASDRFNIETEQGVYDHFATVAFRELLVNILQNPTVVMPSHSELAHNAWDIAAAMMEESKRRLGESE